MITKLGKKQWLTIILFGLIGQIAWSIENMEFNLFLFNYIGGSTTDIANMVAYSAFFATLTTLVMGTVSDRVGHRKMFLCVGYILWGISTLSFAFISRDNISKLTGVSLSQVLPLTVFAVIFMDCVMTFFGSTANDASFNSWVTETTDHTNRTSVEGVLNTFPLLSMLLVAGASGIIIEQTGWPLFFIIMGIGVSICGLLGLFFVKDTKIAKPEHQEGFFATLIYGFKPKVIKENKMFYLTLAGLCVFNIATQIFMPYLLIYLEKTLNFSTLTYSIVMAVVILIASIASIFLGRLIDKLGRKKMGYLAIAIFSLGLIVLTFIHSVLGFAIVGTLMMIGFVTISIVLMSTTRDYTPKEHVGMFQGIRLLAYVLIPMTIGPNIGSFITNNSNAGTYVNSYNEVVNLPVCWIFLAAGICALFIYIPFRQIFKSNRQANQ